MVAISDSYECSHYDGKCFCTVTNNFSTGHLYWSQSIVTIHTWPPLVTGHPGLHDNAALADACR